MNETTTQLSCACGTVRLEVREAPIVSSECCCNSCRSAAESLATRSGSVVGSHGSVRYELYRKDRVRFVAGFEQMREFRLTPGSPTRRVFAACCGTPLFLEFQKGHWLSIFGGLWPAGTLPPLEMRTMASDLADASVLPNDVPNAKTQSPVFMWRLLSAWVAMGFRSPKITLTGEASNG